MDMKLRRDMHLAYVADEAVMAEQIKCRKILQKLNFADRSDFAGIAEIVKELLGKSDDAWINPPFYCDYGFNIEVGRNFFANYNCTIIDVAKVKLEIIVLWLRMLRFIRQDIQFIRIREILLLNMEKKLLSVTMSGWEAIQWCVLVFI